MVIYVCEGLNLQSPSIMQHALIESVSKL